MASTTASFVPEQLLSLAQLLNENPYLSVQLDQIVQAAMELTGSDHADISLFDPFLKRALPPRSNRVFMHEGDDDAAAWIRTNQAHLVVPDVNYTAGDNDLTLYNRDIASYLGVPIMKGSTVEGALLIFNRLPNPFEKGEIALLTALAHLASLAIEQYRLKHDLEETNRILLRLSLTDPATGVATRHQFEQHLDREWLRAQNEGLPLAMMHVHVRLDLDGPPDAARDHRADELALARTARVLQASLYRSGDVIARVGDTQLNVLLPETDEAGALAIARRLRRDVQQLTGESGGNCSEVRLQIGVASYDAMTMRRGPRFEPQDLINQAGLALGKASALDPDEQLAALHLN